VLYRVDVAEPFLGRRPGSAPHPTIETGNGARAW
jgi:hypothetical protein